MKRASLAENRYRRIVPGGVDVDEPARTSLERIWLFSSDLFLLTMRESW